MNLDFVVIHIEKTGGTSFAKMLEQIYKPEEITWWKREHIYPFKLSGKTLEEYLPADTRVFGGHLSYRELQELGLGEEKLVCWLRHPLDRLLSDYAYFIYRMRNHAKNDKQRARARESIWQHVKDGGTVNKMSRFLQGADLENFFFIGHLEYFEEDLIRFSDLVGKPHMRALNLNTNKSVKSELLRYSNEEMQQLVALNDQDMAIYNASLEKLGREPRSDYLKPPKRGSLAARILRKLKRRPHS